MKITQGKIDTVRSGEVEFISGATKNGAQQSANNPSISARGEWFGNSEIWAIGSNYRILKPAKHRRSYFRL